MVEIRCCVFFVLFIFCFLFFALPHTRVTFYQKREHNNLPIWIYYEMHTRNAEEKENQKEKKDEKNLIAR